MAKSLKRFWGMGAVLIGLLPLGLGGCTTFDLQELKRVEPTGSAFHKALADYYLRFAEHEADEYDWIDSQYFAKKGLLAAYGKEVEPEKIEKWKISAKVRPELETARAALLQAMDFDVVTAAPEVSARALFSFDCWIEQQEENSNEDDIKACRTHFQIALSVMQQQKGLPATAAAPVSDPVVAPAPAVAGATPTLVPASAVIAAPAVVAPAPSTPAPLPPQYNVSTTTYVVFFEVNSAALTTDGYRIVRRIAADLKNAGAYEVIIHGQAAAPSPATLATQRTETVQAALIELGIAPETIAPPVLDSKQPMIDSSKTEAKNRRIEIFVTH